MSNIDKQAYRADGGDIGIGRLREIADNPYGDEEKCWLAKRVLALLDELEAKDTRISEQADTIANQDKWISAIEEGMITSTDRAEAAEKRIAELESTAFSKAAIDVLAERERQQSAEGWTTEHDDDHSCGEMALAASSYAQYAHRKPIAPAIPFNWPWEPEWFKQQGPRRDLVKAGALILAEIERIDRAAAGKGEAS
ncbi:ead/Ea22-like family protein [Escherichia coli]|uniref:ead/Ea22-like family protein n=1 Tax=Escherichia coli TaxID=562 RepID=UPI0039BF9A96